MSNLLPLYSSEMNLVKEIHRYGKVYQDDFFDMFICVDSLSIMYCYIIDKVNFKIHKREIVKYHNYVRDSLFNINNEFFEVELKDVDGFWRRDENGVLQIVIYLYFYDYKGKVYNFQLQYLDMDFETFDFKFLKDISGLYNRMVGLLIKKDFMFNDYKSIRTYDTYLMFIKDVQKGIRGKKVYGYRVLVTKNEKEEYNNKYNKDIKIDTIPYVVTEQSPIIYALPDDVVDTKFNFSTGLVFTKFDSEQNREYEQFKV